MNPTIIRLNNSSDPRFVELVTKLDHELAVRDGDDHAFYAQFNKVSALQHIILAIDNEMAVGCGAMKEFDKNRMEIKRMFTVASMRGKGVATNILNELEAWASELNYLACILETGIRQPEAIILYTKAGYSRIPNYGQYKNVAESVCFMKKLK